MAGLNATVSTSSAIALGDATNFRTVLQVVAPSNKGLKIKGFGVTFDGTSSTGARARVAAGRSTTNGSSSNSVTPQKQSGHTGTPTAAAYQGAFGTQPTISAGSEMGVMNVPPTNGVDRRLENFILNPGEAFNVLASANGINCQAYIDYEE